MGTTLFRLLANHAFDRQTDRQTDIQLAFSWLDRVACSARSAINTTYEYRNIRVTATVFFRNN